MAELFDIITYQYKKEEAVEVSEVYTEVVNLTVGVLEAGVYEYGSSWTSRMTSATKSTFARYSTDGGSTWFEFLFEAKDTTDVRPFVYLFPKLMVDGDPGNFILQGRKEDAGSPTCTFDFADLWLKRVG